MLARTLLESMFTFAWIGIARPTTRPRGCAGTAVNASGDNDVISSGAPALLDPQTRADFEQIIAAGPAMPDRTSDSEPSRSTATGGRGPGGRR